MKQRCETDCGTRAAARWLLCCLVTASGVCVGGAGCSREMVISQGDFINNGWQMRRSPDKRTGAPLEINIVCVYPHDLKNDANSQLAPDSGITSDLWYLNRPVPGDKVDDEGNARFRLPKNQIFLLTDDKQFYGKRVGSALRGARTDGKKSRTITFSFSGPLHDSRSAIYVFPKFAGPQRQILPVKPALLSPPGDFTSELTVEIGVDWGREHYGQYIDQTTPRKLHKKADDE